MRESENVAGLGIVVDSKEDGYESSPIIKNFSAEVPSSPGKGKRRLVRKKKKKNDREVDEESKVESRFKDETPE
jgi:hypothetical protein